MFPQIHLNIEFWKLNKEHNVYVSTLGRVKKLDGKDVKSYINASGYEVVFTELKPILLHRLVIETYRGKSSLTIDHIDSNRRNNVLKNLEYVSREENFQRAVSKQLQVEVNLEEEVEKKECSINLTSKVSTKDTKFKNARKAVSWVRNCAKDRAYAECSDEEILKKIKEAIELNTEFCSTKWYLV